MAGYIRQDTTNNIADGNVINASDFDNEYNAIEAAFNASTGHTHDGTSAEGAPITKIGPTQDVVASASALTPKTDNTVDLGSATLEYKDLYIDGTANIDSLVADTADINAGTIDGVTIGGASAGAGTFTTVAATTGNITTVNATTVDATNVEVTNIKAKDGTASMTLADATGVATFSANPILNAGTANGVLYLNGSKVATSGSALTFDGQTLTNTRDTPILNLNDTAASNVALRLLSTGGITYIQSGISAGAFAPIAFTANGGGSEQMRLTSTGLGIGTSSPGQKLDVKGIVSFQATNSTNYWAVYTNTDNTFRWNYNGSGNDELTLDSSGNLGLGVTPSAWGASGTLQALQIKNTSLAGSGTNAYWGSNWYGGGFDKYITTGAASLAVQTGGQHLWYTAPSGTAGNTISFTQAMTLDASGNLGVGTASPNYRLHLAKSGGSEAILSDVDGGGPTQGRALTLKSPTAARPGYVGTETSHDLALYTSNTERARITSGGDLLVNRTTTDGSTVLQVATKSDYGIGIASGVTTTQYVLEFRNANGVVGTVTTSGTATAYNTSSDYRLKDNPQPLTNSGAFIDALQPKTWNWKADGSRGVGFIAHEVQAVSPSSVVGEKDAVDADGKPVMQAMEYGSAEFIANIIAELQSLRARVAALETP